MNEVTYDVENQPTRKSETWAQCKPFSLIAIIQTPSLAEYNVEKFSGVARNVASSMQENNIQS